MTEAKWSSEVGGIFRQAVLMSWMVECRSLSSAVMALWFTVNMMEMFKKQSQFINSLNVQRQGNVQTGAFNSQKCFYNVKLNPCKLSSS